MPRSGQGQALRQLRYELEEHLRNLPPVLEDLWKTLVRPAIYWLLVSLVVGAVLLKIKRLLFPPTPYELHKEALIKFRQDKSPKRSIALLQQAADSDYWPAAHSLAAIYIYRLKQAQPALRVLKPYSGPEVESLRFDARAVLSGNHQMIVSELREQEYLHPIFAEIKKTQ